jgi:phosphate uptake regulator
MTGSAGAPRGAPGDPVANRPAGAVAGDLRIVAALLHVIRCIERIGDQCVNIAKLVPLSGYEAPKVKDILDAIERMGPLARSQVSQAKHAFAARNTELAQDLVRKDTEINGLNRAIFNRGRGRRQPRAARMGHVHDSRGALPGADRRQHS